MEEVDKIIIQSLTSIGCSIDQEIKSIDQFDQDLFIESAALLLNSINSNSGEQLPTKLPPNTGVKFRICSKFASVCQQIGYKNEIGYQTFLYSNGSEMRRLLIYLVEKLTKETSNLNASQSDQTGTKSKNKNNLRNLIAQKFKSSSNQFWLPPNVKLSGLRLQENNQLEKESCKYLKNINTINLDIPSNYSNNKSKFSADFQNYLEKYLKLVSNQAIRASTDVLSSLLELNSLNRLKDQLILKSELGGSDESRKERKEEAVKSLKEKLKLALKELNDTYKSNEKSQNMLTRSDLADIENDLQQIVAKNLLVKGSRFTHSEKLQFTKDSDNQVAIVAGESEEKKEEQIKTSKEKLEELNKAYDEIEKNILSTKADIERIEKECLDQTETNKKFEESIQIKKRTINLINDAPMNILRLKEEINNHEKKMSSLENQWNNVKEPLETEKANLRDQLTNNKVKINQKLEEIKAMRVELDNLNADLTEKETLLAELNKDYETQSKEASKVSNRQFYTRRILEIVASIDKQRKEIDKILIETKAIQKEINTLTGKLERIFNSTDELIFKDAKKDETNKKVYKLFININESYDGLIKTIEDSSHIKREIRDMEDQVNTESQNKIADNLEKLLKDFKQIKEENEHLIKSGK